MTRPENVKNVTVVGVGIMGSGIAQALLLAGYPKVVFNDVDTAQLASAKAATERIIKGLATAEDFKASNTGNVRGGETAARYEENRKAIMEGRTVDEILRHAVY